MNDATRIKMLEMQYEHCRERLESLRNALHTTGMNYCEMGDALGPVLLDSATSIDITLREAERVRERIEEATEAQCS